MESESEIKPEFMVLRDLDATHARRVRLIVHAGSAALILIGLGFAVYFIARENWRIAAFELSLMAIGIVGAVLARRNQMRVAVLLMLLSIFFILCTMALIMDVPTSRAPRAVHLYFMPLALASYIMLKMEMPWLRHGFSIGCLTAAGLFAVSTVGISSGLRLPDETHVMIDWVDCSCAMGLLYILLNIVMGDVNRMENYLHAANNRFVSLVSGMFPKVIAERLLANRQTFAERYANCSVLFADIVGFTELTERMAPEAMIAMLADVFLRFDRCVDKYGLTKIKTIGDAYMVAAGVPEPDPNHARQMIELATQLLDVVKDFPDIELRIGIASGELVPWIGDS
jgi:hypothetical protein